MEFITTSVLAYIALSYVAWYFVMVRNDSGVPFGKMFWLVAPIALPVVCVFKLIKTILG